MFFCYKCYFRASLWQPLKTGSYSGNSCKFYSDKSFGDVARKRRENCGRYAGEL